MIELKDIFQTYQSPTGPVEALRGVNLHIKPGEVFGIIGRSGAGKSSLVRVINLLNRPAAGQVMVGGRDLTALGDDALRVARFGVVGALYDRWLGDGRPGANQVTVRVSQGLDAFGAASSARTGARVGFAKITLDATRVQTLFAPWDGASVALQTTLAGQWSNDVLPLAEKFYLGGSRLGRGYFAGQVTGDRALAASAELQLTTSIDTSLFGTALNLRPTLYGFYDWGQSWENRAVDANRRLSSLGIGLRLPIEDRYEIQLEGVHRETRQPGGAGSARLQANAVFWHLAFRL